MMINKKLKSLVIGGLAVGAITAGGISVFAASNASSNTTNTTSSIESKWKNGDCKNKTKDFSGLVSKGIIDQATADKMTAFMEQFKTNMQAEMDKVKSMSDADKKAYFQSNKDKIDIFNQMVSQGIITQNQADSIKSAMPKGFSHKFNTSDLVTKGVIDQATADKITAYKNEKKSDLKNNKGKQRTDFLTDMVNDGVITQIQADSIKSAMQNN